VCVVFLYFKIDLTMGWPLSIFCTGLGLVVKSLAQQKCTIKTIVLHVVE
jgi:hypothetical protein